MKILVINCGSSSLKYQLINMEDENVLAKGLVERIGIEGSILTHKVNGEKYITEQPMEDHKIAIKLVLNALVDKDYGVIKDMSEISAVGHRVVHGGEKYANSVLVDEDVVKAIKDCAKLAPLHNVPNMIGINACKELMPDTPMVATFDTAFHQTLPNYAYTYAVPYDLYEKYGVRKYGFHGTSHKFVSIEAAKMMGKDIRSLKIITCHLGNGASVCAIDGGKSIDTSMGFTPLAGLCMGTRCGDIDPAVIPFLVKSVGMSIDEVDTLMNKKSGVLGVSGVSSDFRDVLAEEAKGNKRAELALNVYTYRVKSVIGSYIAALNGVDCIVFTAGSGENSEPLRRRICAGLSNLGIVLDKERNNVMGKPAQISSDDSKVKVFAIPTNEELMIARDTKEIVEGR
ncbi:acetate/propionate family kinase [Clostridium tyrobutyricum]|jgi:acetate kinase|uniref:Acetate kinase n=1 Tax=Clostridium tyrobutyricum DIVETGP TaxID=1408889 RepID=W6N4S6_CLOTY|nr:acetate kinase [Clostridium tyrobutyricum]AND85077.1 acetate kinase [Clostridium tyrobutyricum]ANP69636.1 acetate kinase [Clostridium tyrobutyricum]MBR9647027.1 acetate kinase [Clostridium tyrobutyricum]MBV4420765.1 acetate kinase [Clostridium tyrobutyricum]MBV4423876.1 acetate kinase [Clostridium tyrobutyricum]